MMTEVKAYHCDKCDGYYLKEKHYCRGERKCEDCGITLDTKWYYTICKDCKEKREENKLKEKFERATKMTLEEYEKIFAGYPYFHDEENCSFDADYLFEIVSDNSETSPTFFWGAEQVEISLSYDDIAEILLEHDNSYEDYGIDDEAKDFIYNFVKEYNEKFTDYNYFINYDIVILIPEEWITQE